LLGVGGYFLFFHDSGQSSPSANSNPAPLVKANPSDNTTPGAPATGGGNPAIPGGTIPGVPATSGGLSGEGLAMGLPVMVPFNEISNLLPGDAQTVYRIHMDKMRACTLGQQAFESRVGFKPDTFRQKLGIGVEEISLFVRAENLEGNWSFNVFRTIRPVTLDEFIPASVQIGRASC